MHRILISLIFTSIIYNFLNANTLQQQILLAKNKVLPALVHIEPIKEVFSSGKRIKIQVTGSGVIFSPDGLVLTNNHVAEKARYVTCTLANRIEVPAEVVGLDALTDLAVLKLDLSNADMDSVPYINFGDSDSLEVGEIVMALGSPLGLSRSLSLGVISSIDRYFEDRGVMVSPFNLWIQTDAAINPGNSGGPLLNTDGAVIGINSAIIPYAQGIGFAIPISVAKRNLDDLITLGKVRRSWLGVYIQEVTPEIAEQFDLEKADGVLIGDVIESSPAEEAGLVRGDVILSVNNKEVNTPQELQDAIRDLEIRDEAELRVIRNGKEVSFNVIIGEMPSDESITSEEKILSISAGISVEVVSPEIAREAGLSRARGLVITDVIPGSSADDMGLRSGDIILEANRKEVSSIAEWEEIISKKDAGDTLLLLVFRSGHTYYAPIKIEEVD